MSQTKRAYDKFLLYALLIIGLGVVGFISATTVIDPSYISTTGPISGSTGTFTGALTGTTLDTGQGANELFDMDQNVLQASAVTFATVDTGQGANELYDMNQNVMTSSAVTFTTVNTGQGANELYDMDQNVMATSSVTFDDVAITDNITIGGITRTTWPQGADFTILHGYTAYVGFDVNKSGFDNYFYCDGTNDHVEIQSAIDYAGGIEDSYTVFLEMGVYDVTADIVFRAGDVCIFAGDGRPKLYTSPLTSGGTILNCVDDAQITGGTSAGVTFKNIGFYFDGTYTDSCIDFIDGGGVINAHNSFFMVDCIVPNGNAGNPASTLSGNCINIGKVAGPPGVYYEWVSNVFVDQREGSATASTFLCFVVEHGEFRGNSFFPYPAKTLDNPNFMFVSPVSSFRFVENIWYLQPGWTAAPTGQYYNMYMSSGANKNLFFYEDQFLADAQIENSHIYTNSGNTYVYGTFPHTVEGGTTPVDLSVDGSGTVHIRFDGRGYETWGSATISTGTNTTGNIAHTLVGTPTYIVFTGTTDETSEVWCSSADATNIVGLVNGTVSGDSLVYYYARYSKVG